MAFVLFPGRHHLLTRFQIDYLDRVTRSSPGSLHDIEGKSLEEFTPFDSILWCVTSANHSNTRRNPIPANRREAAIEGVGQRLNALSYVFHIDDLGTTDRFAEYVLKKIEVDSRGTLTVTPDNTVVACSTPEVIKMYERLGYRILPVELECREPPNWKELTPWQILNKLIEAGVEGANWNELDLYQERVNESTRLIYEKYQFPERIIDLHRSPLLTEDGDLTETRDYNTYVRSFDQGAERKFQMVAGHLRPGRIVDIGCCTGALLREVSLDDRFRESDLYGIEVARPLYDECIHRKEQGHFGNDHVFFYQQDFAARTLFPSDSIDTFTTFALTHEIESYGGRSSLHRFIELIYEQTALMGRWINLDVVGPEQKDQLVWARLSTSDGDHGEETLPVDPMDRAALKKYLQGLSTAARFDRFTKDFRAGYDETFEFDWVDREQAIVALRLEDLCEFLSKKDYVDNWMSEMHERFCFWSESDWRSAVERVGFRVAEASGAFQNPWIVENRYQGFVELLEPHTFKPLPYPVTNLLLVAEKVGSF